MISGYCEISAMSMPSLQGESPVKQNRGWQEQVPVPISLKPQNTN